MRIILQSDEIEDFRKKIWEYYRINGRDMPWRHTCNPYHILVSEIMLQQTQVERVAGKYLLFLSAFPDFPSLSRAPLRAVLSLWQGLGYNRRAIALHHTAKEVTDQFNGVLPSSADALEKLPGIGKATASAIAAFAFNAPVAFIETNIRRVFIHCFLSDRDKVPDKDILPLVVQTLDHADPRRWYYALMDYGAMLKGSMRNPNKKSAHYRKQAAYQGSIRQLRGLVLKEFLEGTIVTETALSRKLSIPSETIRKICLQLRKEGFLKLHGKRFSIV
ncbi:MAG: A/G-specific adenine glycosylase [Nitrospirota bacterium]